MNEGRVCPSIDLEFVSRNMGLACSVPIELRAGFVRNKHSELHSNSVLRKRERERERERELHSCCSVERCVAVCCFVLQCVTVRNKPSELHSSSAFADYLQKLNEFTTSWVNEFTTSWVNEFTTLGLSGSSNLWFLFHRFPQQTTLIDGQTRLWVKSHVWVSHVTRMHGSCHTYGQVDTNQSCYTYESARARTHTCTHAHTPARQHARTHTQHTRLVVFGRQGSSKLNELLSHAGTRLRIQVFIYIHHVYIYIYVHTYTYALYMHKICVYTIHTWHICTYICTHTHAHTHTNIHTHTQTNSQKQL